MRGPSIRKKYTVKDIPYGSYCYMSIETPEEDRKLGIRRIKCCPFLDWNKWAPSQSYGYCHLIKSGDWHYNGTMILWDQCKSCGENDYSEEEYNAEC